MATDFAVFYPVVTTLSSRLPCFLGAAARYMLGQPYQSLLRKNTVLPSIRDKTIRPLLSVHQFLLVLQPDSSFSIFYCRALINPYLDENMLPRMGDETIAKPIVRQNSTRNCEESANATTGVRICGQYFLDIYVIFQ
jgi:hypothetical protein